MGKIIVEGKKIFVTPERVVLYFGIRFFPIPVIKVVKKLINKKTRENRWIFENHLIRAKIICKFVK